MVRLPASLYKRAIVPAQDGLDQAMLAGALLLYLLGVIILGWLIGVHGFSGLLPGGH